jgi:hypothetical protein
MSIISGTANWMGDTDNPKKKVKAPVVKKESEFTDAKKLKLLANLLTKTNELEASVNEAYGMWPTSEMSTIGTLISSIKFNIKKVKPTKE